MALLTELDATQIPARLRTGVSRGVVACGRAGCVASAGAMLALCFNTGLPAHWRVAALAAAAVAMAASLAAIAWTNGHEIDLRTGSCVSVCGVYPSIRRRSTPLSTFDHVEIVRHWQRIANPAEALRTVRLGMGQRAVVLLRRSTDPHAASFAAELAERAGLPLVESMEVPREANGVIRTATTTTIWAAMFAVVVIMLWPVVSGSKPIHVNFAGADTANGIRSSQLTNALGLYYAGHYADSESAYRLALRESPFDKETWNMLAYACAQQNKLDEALSHAEKALSLAPGDGNILDTVGEMHERRREYRTAAKYYEIALTKIPVTQSQETRAKYGRTLLAMNKRSRAVPLLREAAEGPPSEWCDLAIKLLKTADPNYQPLARTRSSRIFLRRSPSFGAFAP